jgi:hypothetical protein
MIIIIVRMLCQLSCAGLMIACWQLLVFDISLSVQMNKQQCLGRSCVYCQAQACGLHSYGLALLYCCGRSLALACCDSWLAVG